MSTLTPELSKAKPAQRRRVGKYTTALPTYPRIKAVYTAGGPKEGAGPLGDKLDTIYEDHLLGQRSWEQAESFMLQSAVERCMRKAGVEREAVDMLIAGDLLNQNTGSSFAARSLDLPFIDVFSACATMSQATGLAGILVDGGYAGRIVVAVSSHHDTAERQYRFPTEYGTQRPPTAQWTATGATALLIGDSDERNDDNGTAGEEVAITHVTFGRVIDMGIQDPYNMGGAMAAAAADTIHRHLQDTGRSLSDYDFVATGDLARIGHPVAADLLERRGHKVDDRFTDCALLLYDFGQIGGIAGASGCACSGIVFGAHFYPQMLAGRIRRLLLVATGSLHNKLTYEQGETIPATAHAVAFEVRGAKR